MRVGRNRQPELARTDRMIRKGRVARQPRMISAHQSTYLGSVRSCPEHGTGDCPVLPFAQRVARHLKPCMLHLDETVRKSPCSLERSTQSRDVCRSIPPILAGWLPAKRRRGLPETYRLGLPLRAACARAQSLRPKNIWQFMKATELAVEPSL